jgi:hypothetical protein
MGRGTNQTMNSQPIRKGRINLECPPYMRQAQTLIHFLGWINKERDVAEAAIFKMEDEQFEKLYAEFLAAAK